jgi:hypothetical protein
MQMDENKLTRRLFLAGAGSVTVGSSALSSSVVAKGRGKAKGNQNTGRKAFPPKGITEQTEGQRLGNGKVSTFSSVTPSGKPKYVGIHFSAAAQEGLPTPEELEESGEGGSGSREMVETISTQTPRQCSGSVRVCWVRVESTGASS